MFKNAVRLAVLTAAIVLTAATAVAQEGPIRIAVVDLDRLVAESSAGRELQQALRNFEQQVQQEGQSLADKAKATRQLIADGANSLSEERLAELQKQYEDETIAVRRFTDDKQRQGQKMQQEGLRKIEERLQPVFEQVRNEGGYDLILNRAYGVVVMASDRVDITPRVISLFEEALANAAGASGDG